MNTKLYSIADAATECGVTPGRIRQLRGELNVGQHFGPVWMLTRGDVRELQKALKKMGVGRPRKKVEIRA